MKSVEIMKRGRGRPKKGPVEVSKASSSSSTSAGSDSDSNNSGRSDVDSSLEGSQKNQSSSSSSSSSSFMAKVEKTGTFCDSSQVSLAPGFQSVALGQSPSPSTVMVEGSNEDSNLTSYETRWGCFGAGQKVFAYWKGKTSFSTGYYSGTIIEKGVLNVYKIHFDDGTVSNTSEAQILPVRVLGVGVKVFYLPDEMSNGPMSALVVGQKSSCLDLDGGNDIVEYAIKCYGSSDTIVCKRKQLYLGVPQAKELRKKYEHVQPKLADVNLDNVILQPRQRATPKPIDTPVKRKSLPEKSNKKKSSVSDTPSTKSTPSKKKRTEKSVILHDRPSKTHSVPRTDSRVDKCPIEDSLPRVTSRERDGDSLSEVNQKFQNQSSKTGKQQGAINPTNASLPATDHTQSTIKTSTKNTDLQSPEVKLPGEVNKSHEDPIPRAKVKRKGKDAKESTTKMVEIKGNLFLGYYFFLTAGEKNYMKGVPNVKEISKTEMQGMIASHQGKELVSLGDEKNKDPGKVFLLASCHLRTLKYLYCVATGIPCVAQKWMEDCVNGGTLRDWKEYQLSPGWSLENNRLAPAHKNFPLENMTIGLATFKKETVDTWETLIPAAKGVVQISKEFHHEKQPAELKVPEEWLNGAIDILVSDFFCSKDVCDTLKSKGIPVVRIEWLVQTIIMGKKCDYKVGEGWNH